MSPPPPPPALKPSTLTEFLRRTEGRKMKKTKKKRKGKKRSILKRSLQCGGGGTMQISLGFERYHTFGAEQHVSAHTSPTENSRRRSEPLRRSAANHMLPRRLHASRLLVPWTRALKKIGFPGGANNSSPQPPRTPNPVILNTCRCELGGC